MAPKIRKFGWARTLSISPVSESRIDGDIPDPPCKRSAILSKVSGDAKLISSSKTHSPLRAAFTILPSTYVKANPLDPPES